VAVGLACFRGSDPGALRLRDVAQPSTAQGEISWADEAVTIIR
jgi:hypothetical protein